MSDEPVVSEELQSLLNVPFGPEVYEIEKGMIRRFVRAVGDSNPLWQDEESAKKTSYGGIIAPPTFALILGFDQLQQVCTNLILNAIQAMPEGGKLTLSTSLDNHSQLKVEVQDTGYGISPENMRKLFTPFFTTKGKGKGVGLGLAVAYGIIQRHHGRIEVQSEEGKGTTFTIYLKADYEEKG